MKWSSLYRWAIPQAFAEHLGIVSIGEIKRAALHQARRDLHTTTLEAERQAATRTLLARRVARLESEIAKLRPDEGGYSVDVQVIGPSDADVATMIKNTLGAGSSAAGGLRSNVKQLGDQPRHERHRT